MKKEDALLAMNIVHEKALKIPPLSEQENNFIKGASNQIATSIDDQIPGTRLRPH